MDLSRLNDPQRQAVEHGDEPLLVLAGAGTGKTTVITYRIAHLLEARGVPPDQILAVTFTNKAAREMRERSGRLCRLDPRRLDIATFHASCGRLLRRYGTRIGLDSRFVIYDEDDQRQLIRRCAADLGIDSQKFAPRNLRARIEQWKNRGLGPNRVQVPEFDVMGERALQVYQIYEKRCLDANAVDFGDLLLHTVTLLATHPDVSLECRARWSHILVDEYQDTNPVQYQILASLVTPTHSLTVVGDDDQSIYRWRGADIGNILRFEKDFPGARLIRLEQNYRSTQVILSAANAVIARNASRKGKTLFTKGDTGDRLRLRLFREERDEGEAIADAVAGLLATGVAAGEIAVLYRTNAQSRPVEDALRRRRIRYAIYGGVRFYDRREVRDALAYLRLVVNPRSEVDFLRVVNAPARGIGKTSLKRLSELAASHHLSLYEAARRGAAGEGGINGKPRNSLKKLVAVMDRLRDAASSTHPARLLEDVLESTDYLPTLRMEGTDRAEDRIANLNELVTAVEEYVGMVEDPSLEGFLEEVTLAADIDGMAEENGEVTLMTLHSAKGLEFEQIFMIGMEEGIFPHSRSIAERGALEEERRLCYVGMTRAKKALHFSAARARQQFGERTFSELSRFVAEVPDDLLAFGDEPNGRPARSGPLAGTPDPYALALEEEIGVTRLSDERQFAAGDRVFHRSFGEGTVLSSWGAGKDQKLTIEFPQIGQEKVVVAKFVERR